MTAELLQHRLESPDGTIAIEIFLTKGRLQYAIQKKGQVVMEAADLGVTVDGRDLGLAECFGPLQGKSMNETYPVRGGHSIGVNRCMEWTIPVVYTEETAACELHVRLYDDGAAFRYFVPGSGERTVNGEASSWRIPDGSRVWYFERNNDWKLKSYAGEFIHTESARLHEASSQGPLQGTPLVIELPSGQGYAAIMEAALYDYSGMRLEAVGEGIVRANFTEGERGFAVDGPILTPWRVTLCAADLNGLVNSDLLTNLNPPPSEELFADTGYLKPGRSVWSWWSSDTGTVEDEREMMGLAAELGFEYTTIDEGWELWPKPWQQLAELTEYGRNAGVGIFVWKRSKEIDDPGDDWRQLRQFLDRVSDAGVAGVKIDFIDNEAKTAIDFEIAALEQAAKRKLIVNFHGISKPTGECRTYPNELTREGIRGLELNKMEEGPIPAWHNAALPFTRFVAGHGDYTPVGFSNPGHTTAAHQLATAIVFTSPIQVIAEHPRYLLQQPAIAPAVDILRTLPSVWDETIVLASSSIGELAAFARRSGNTWFVAWLNGLDRPVRLENVDLSFLGEGRYNAYYVEDAELKDAIDASRTTPAGALVNRMEEGTGQDFKLNVELKPVGGFVARFNRI
ncbi:glycoside hydrolase family 97 protein [Paenibacillus pasadenensis]|uniref:glycoside hydrolase family 97 protein n=1 Tax=Paenibacillus pasadenensis TaxID=217090 RepID=UPI00203A9311|nr:glycoside hydrolase family 97 protein [Paenibacillus pasadenensis]MCM3747005.1 glycoside hydrolase family 97 protein [Paenibacillus pasadenensis]